MYSRGREVAFSQEVTTDEFPKIPYGFAEKLIMWKTFSPFKIESELKELYETTNPEWTVFRDDIASMDPNKGQIEKAFKACSTWGFHYLAALQCAYRYQMKINFKDASLDNFSSDELRKYVEKGEELFKTIPVSKKTVQQVTSRGGTATAMSSYMSSSGVCFSPDTEVETEKGGFVVMKDIKKGDILKGGHKVKCVIVFDRSVSGVVAVGCSMELTPWHPYKERESDTEWRFPNPEDTSDVLAVYNLFLESGHVVYGRDGRQAVTLAHGFQEKVVRHPFFGTRLCEEDLKVNFPKEFEEGLVKLSGVLRSRFDGLGETKLFFVCFSSFLLK